jgi:fatty acid desaturase
VNADATAAARQRLSSGLDVELTALRRQRPARRVAEIAFFASLWIAGMLLSRADFDLAGIALSAAALNAFFLLSHEGHHHLLFRNRRVNHVVNLVLCVPLLHSPTAYRVLHELHHRFLGGPGDPDDFRNYTSSSRVRWALHWVRLTMGTLVYMPLIPIVAWRRAGREDRRAIELEYAGMMAIWVPVFLLIPMPVLLQLWLIPGVLVGYISAVRAVAQHALTPPDDPLLASRSVQSNPVVAFFLLNENFHLEHHLFPEVPSYNLPGLRALLRLRLPATVQARSYSRFMARFIGRFLRGDESPLVTS